MTSLLRSVATASALLLAAASPAIAAAPGANDASIIGQWDGFSAPTGITLGPDGAIYVSNWSGGSVERITPNGVRSVFLKGIASPAGVAIDSSGAAFVASYADNYIVRVAPDGATRRIAENLATPTGLVFSAAGRLLVANRASGEILSINPTSGERHLVASGLSLPVGLVEMKDGSVVVSQYGGRVTRIAPNGTTQELGQDFERPGVGVLADGDDAVFVIDNGANLVRRVSFDGQTRVVGGGWPGSAVALGRAENGDLLVGAWGENAIYRFWPQQ